MQFSGASRTAHHTPHPWFGWCLLLLATTLLANAKDRFPETITHDSTQYSKLGEHRYVYAMLFKLYDAALYTTPTATADDILNYRVPFKLNFQYLRTIEKSIVLKSSAKMLERNLTPAQLEQIAERVTQINQAYRTVQKDDHSSLSYQPGIGTTFALNGKAQITIPGDDFARLYFQIWLGKQPISNELKQKLLGLAP